MQDDSHVLSSPDATLNAFRSLGATDVRIFMGWASIAPSPDSHRQPHFSAGSPGGYPASHWAPYDAAVRAAAARGMGVNFVLTGPGPLWAAKPAPRRVNGVTDRTAHDYEPNAAEFGAFVAAVGKRYSGGYTPSGSSSPLPRVKFWAIWDEPNYGFQLAPQAVNGVEVAPMLYRSLLNHAWTSLRATGHGGDQVLIGDTAPRGATNPGVANGLMPLRFLRALYCVNSRFQQLRGSAAAARGCPTSAGASRRFRSQNPGLFSASGFAAHLYTSGQVASPKVPSPSFAHDYAGLYDLPNLQRTLDRLQAAYGSHTHYPIYNTEFGFQTNPPQAQCGCVFLSPTTAAYYLNWSEYLEWANPRIRSDAQYLLFDAPGPPGNVTTESVFSSGLSFLDGKPKATYAAFQLPLYLPTTSTSSGHALTVWGQVRAAPYAQRDSGSTQQVEIQFQPSSGGSWTTVSTATITNSAGYFRVPVTFPSSGSVRLQWSYPNSFLLLPPYSSLLVTSRTQAITIH
ncbi:MAG: polysaccharide biosynthesis protein PslG [Solirubrobacteraceae bacterium]|nr:polysaccharide biosynthesis protein PslG [Solirubrobacteraceae bacterium]